MKKNGLILTLICLMGIGSAWGDNEAVYCRVTGSSTCYRLSDQPVITYSDSAAVLTINGVEQLRLPMEDISQLTITYGEYQYVPPVPTDNEQVSGSFEVQPVEKVGKYIRGGRLIIVKDGKMYDAQGREVVK